MITSGIDNTIQGYIDGVLDGSIVVSKRVRECVERHVADLQRQSTPEFPYHFDAKHAGTVCDFFPVLVKHSIGEFAGRPLHLEPWQAFAIWCIFGWKRNSDNTRRFRKVYWSMARKNGKSTIAAGLSLFLGMVDIDPKTGKPEAVGQILLTATKKDQAKVVFSEAERMRNQSTPIKRQSDCKNETITFKHNQSYIRPIGSDKPYDGLNPHCVVMDELHAWKEFHRKFYDTMVTGFGSRSQPMQFIITTAGADDSHLWLDEYNYAVEICKGIVKDESVFAFIAEIDDEDDPFDESCWIKANPNLGVSVNIQYLRDLALKDSRTALGRNRFKRYNCNKLVSSTERVFDLVQWDSCGKELSDWTTADAVGAGVDLGGRDDLAAWALVARFIIGEKDDKPVYRYEAITQAYIGEDCTRDLTQSPFAEWVHWDYIKKCKFPIKDLRDDLVEQCKTHGVGIIAYDPANGQQLGEELTQEGFEAARCGQTHTMFNEPIKELLAAITEGRFSHGGVNPLLRWCANNAIVYKNRNDFWMYDKKTSSEKIDPIVAMTMAFRIAMIAPARATGSLYL